MEHFEELWSILECAVDLLRDEACKITEVLFKGLRDLVCSEIFKKTAFIFARKIKHLGRWTKEFALSSQEKSLEFLTKSPRPKEPRLISGFVKELIRGKEEEKPQRLISAWFQSWR